MDVEQPKGNFLLPEDTEKPYAFIAGGIGITFFRSMLRYIAEEKLPHRGPCLLEPRPGVHRGPSTSSSGARARDPGALKVVFTMTDDSSWDGERRRIDA